MNAAYTPLRNKPSPDEERGLIGREDKPDLKIEEQMYLWDDLFSGVSE